MLKYVAQGGRLRLLAAKGDTPPALPGEGDRQSHGFGKITVYRTNAADAVTKLEAGWTASPDNPFNNGALFEKNDPTGDPAWRALAVSRRSARRRR